MLSSRPLSLIILEPAIGKEVSAYRAPHVKVRIDETCMTIIREASIDLGTLSGQLGPNIRNESVTHKHVRFRKSAERHHF